MAVITEHSRLNVDVLNAPIIGVATKLSGHEAEIHKHAKHQLLFASSGCMSIKLSNIWCIVPASRAVWIPAGTCHRVRMRNVMTYRSLYFDAGMADLQCKEVRILLVNGLLKELIDRMAHWEWDMPEHEQEAIFSLFCQEFKCAEDEHFALRLPYDRRLRGWLEDVMTGKVLPEPLVEMSKDIGASAKTISRIFTRETGIPYQAWRQQWRLQVAIERLSEGECVSKVSKTLKFSSDSAFISFFRKMAGSTPRRYLRESSD